MERIIIIVTPTGALRCRASAIDRIYDFLYERFGHTFAERIAVWSQDALPGASNNSSGADIRIIAR